MKKFLALLIVLIGIGCYFLIRNMLSVKENTHTDLEIYSNGVSGIQFQYPKIFSGNIRRPLVWPPVVQIVTSDPVLNWCPEMKDIVQTSGSIQGKTDDGLSYSLYQGSDVGAGQLYTLYCYVVEGKNNYYVFDITIHSPNGCWGGNCGAYCGTPFEQECKSLDRAKDILLPLTNVVATLKIKENLSK